MYNSLSIHGGVCNELGLFPELSEGKRRRGKRYEFLMGQALLGRERLRQRDSSEEENTNSETFVVFYYY